MHKNSSTTPLFTSLTEGSFWLAFGSGLKGRSFNADKYRAGFNGKENDNEVKGNGNQQNYGMRIYDPRLGRFLSTDPITRIFPELTPYQFASNTPIQAIDLDGLEAKVHVHWIDRDGKSQTKSLDWKYIGKKGEYNGALGMGDIHFYYTSDGKIVKELSHYDTPDMITLLKRYDEKLAILNGKPIFVNEKGSASANTNTPTGEFDGNTNPLISKEGENTGGGSSDSKYKDGKVTFDELNDGDTAKKEITDRQLDEKITVPVVKENSSLKRIFLSKEKMEKYPLIVNDKAGNE